MKFYFFIILIQFLSVDKISAQNKFLNSKIFFAKGTQFYSRGIDEDSFRITGYYFFKEDSTFFFLGYNVKHSTLESAGTGQWFMLNDSLHISFLEPPAYLLLNSEETSYSGRSRKNFDSIYLQLLVTDEKNVPINYVDIIFNNWIEKGYSKGMLFQKGILNKTFPLSNYPLISSVSLTSLMFNNFSFIIPPNYNDHSFHIKLSKRNKDFIVLKDINMLLPYHKSIGDTAHYIGRQMFIRQNLSEKYFREILQNTEKKNQVYKRLFDYLEIKVSEFFR